MLGFKDAGHGEQVAVETEGADQIASVMQETLPINHPVGMGMGRKRVERRGGRELTLVGRVVRRAAERETLG
jgi:hypothetical protein